MTVGYLASAFDLLNVRDLDALGQAQLLCSRLIVGVLSDDLATHVSGRRPVVPLAERLALVSHVRGVDEVCVHDEKGPPPGVERTFCVAGDPPLPGLGHGWLLTPRRETASLALREALNRLPVEDVA